jgi:hypothetical protein
VALDSNGEQSSLLTRIATTASVVRADEMLTAFIELGSKLAEQEKQIRA